MRHDVVIDRRQSGYLKNASTLGYGKYKAQCGDLVTFRYPEDTGQPHLARVIGRIKYAPPCGETPAIHNWLLVLQLSETGTSVYERWIDPDWILTCQSPAGHAEFLAYLFGPDLPMGEDARYLAHYGSLSADQGGFNKGQSPAEYNRAILARRDAQLKNVV